MECERSGDRPKCTSRSVIHSHDRAASVSTCDHWTMQSGVGGHQAANVTAFRSERIILTVKRGEGRNKVVQIIFGRDGSLFVSFPYFKHRSGILAAATI